MTGFFVAFEGVDGAGKTSLVAEVVSELGRHVCTDVMLLPTAEPYDREAVKARIQGGAREITAYSEDRTRHLDDVIFPALDAGQVVLCDRYYLSTVANNGTDHERIDTLNQRERHLAPDLWVYLRISPRTATRRVWEREGRTMPTVDDREVWCEFERDCGDASSRVYRYNAATTLERELGAAVVVIDATHDVQHNAKRVAREILRRWLR